MEDAIAGGMAGLVASGVTHPIDTMKTRSITGLGHKFPFYRGFPAVALLSTVGNGLYFGGYSWASEKLEKAGFGDLSTPLIGGAVANLITLIAWVPQDVIKERQQTNNSQQYRTMSSTARHVVNEYGFFKGLYRGFGWSVILYTPMCSLYFLLYESYKKRISSYLNISIDSLAVPHHALGGLVCGAVSAAVTTPVDYLKIRRQVGLPPSSIPFLSRSFARAAAYRVGAIAPNYALTIALWESCRKFVSGVVN